MNKIYYRLLLCCFLCFNTISAYSQEMSGMALVDRVTENDRLACYYDSLGDIEKAIHYAKENVEINRQVGETSVPYAVSLLNLARYEKGEVPNDAMTKRGLAILKDSLGTKSSIYINYLLEFAWRMFNNDQIQEACSIVKDVADKEYKGDESYLGYLYYSYAHFSKVEEEYDEALKYALKAESFFNDKKMWSDDYYTKTMLDLGILCASNQEVSFNYLSKAKQNIEKYKGKDCIDYLDVLLNLAYLYRANNQLEESLSYAKQAKEVGEKIQNVEFGTYIYTLHFLSGQYSSLHQYSEAIKYAEECLSLMKESNDFSLEDRLPTLDSLIVYNWKLWNKESIEKSNVYAKEAYLIRKSTKTTDEELTRNIYYLLHSNYNLGKYQECEENVKEIRAIYGDSYSTDYKHYFDDMWILMNSYYYRNLYKETLASLKEIENYCCPIKIGID